MPENTDLVPIAIGMPVIAITQEAETRGFQV